MQQLLLLTILTACQLMACNHPAPKQATISTPKEAPSSPTPTEADWKDADKDYLKEGQTLLQEAIGDLNRDGILDKVLVLENPPNTPSLNGLSAPRTLLLLQGNATGQYRLWASSDKAVLCAECGGVLGDPFRSITIEKGSIHILQDGGSRERWERKSSLILSPTSEKWMVVKDQMKVVDTYDANNNSNQNLLTEEQLPLEEYNVYGEQ